MPKISVIIPTYNRVEFLPAAVDSVLAQSVKDVEIIVVDDGSTDGTAGAISAYGPPVVYIYQNNRGQGAARNRGIQAASGELVAFLDSDDLWLPAKLEKQLARLAASNEADWVYCDVEYFDAASGEVIGQYSHEPERRQGWIGRSLLNASFITSPTPIVPKSIFDEVGLFDESRQIPLGEDWDLWLRIAARHQIAYVPEVLARIRYHQDNVSLQEDLWVAHRSRIAVVERAVAYAPDIYGPYRSEALAKIYLQMGERLARQGELKDARRMFLKAIRRQPGLTAAYPRLGLALSGRRISGWFIERYRKRLKLLNA